MAFLAGPNRNMENDNVTSVRVRACVQASVCEDMRVCLCMRACVRDRECVLLIDACLVLM